MIISLPHYVISIISLAHPSSEMTHHLQIITTLRQAQTFFNEISALSSELNHKFQENLDIYNKVRQEPYNNELLAQATNIHADTISYINQKHRQTQSLEAKFLKITRKNDLFEPLKKSMNMIEDMQSKLQTITGFGDKKETSQHTVQVQ